MSYGTIFSTGLIVMLVPILPSKAATLVNASVEVNPDSVNLLFDDYMENRIADVVLVAQGTSSPKAKEYFGLAKQKFVKGDYSGALADLNRVIQLDPKYAQAYSNRASIKVFLKDYQGALNDYNSATKLDPRIVTAYTGRGALKTITFKDYQGALTDLNQAVKIDPNFVDAYNNLAVLKYYHLKDRSGGISDLKKVVKLLQQKGESKKALTVMKTLKEWEAAASKASVV